MEKGTYRSLKNVSAVILWLFFIDHIVVYSHEQTVWPRKSYIWINWILLVALSCLDTWSVLVWWNWWWYVFISLSSLAHTDMFCITLPPPADKKVKDTVYSNANKQYLIFRPPAILTLHLKRFEQVCTSYICGLAVSVYVLVANMDILQQWFSK